MGRWPGDGRYTVEECVCLDIFFFRKKGWIPGLKAGTLKWIDSYGETGDIIWGIKVDELDPYNNFIRLRYWNIWTEEELNYTTPIVSTPCNFGGERYWFKCFCGRKVGKLYLAPGRKYFDCKACCNLYYSSQKNDDSYFLKKMERIFC